MKKFLKILITIILVGLSIGGACLIFFYNYNKNKDKTFEYIANFLSSSEFEEVQTNIKTINTMTENRFDAYLETKENLDSIGLTFNTYFVNEDDYSINHKPTIKKMKEVESALRVADDMADEFILKMNDNKGFFDPKSGANALFSQTSQILVLYSQALDEMAVSMDKLKINKSADIKFAMIEAYLDVVEDTFTNLKDGDFVTLNNSNNLTLFNGVFEIENSILVTKNSSNFSHLNNQFISAYNECDKAEFAKNLSTNVASISAEFTLGENQTMNATYLFKLIYEV